MSGVVEQFMSVLEPCGLNLHGVVSADAYDQTAKPSLRTDALAPGTRSIIVFASSGGRLWSAFLDDLRRTPDHLRCEQHPLDAYVSRCLHRVSQSIPNISHRWFTPALDAPVHIDFRTLAVNAGIGAPSRLGLVIRPDVGPWLGLRAACFVSVELPASAPIMSVCDGCRGYCETACVGGAFTHGQWDVLKCTDFHQVDVACANSCNARMACPVGADSRYSELQRQYHYNRKNGRRVLAKYLGIEGDTIEGLGPDWGGWSSSAPFNEKDTPDNHE